MKKNKGKLELGFSLIEILIVVVIFATVGVIATQSTLLSLRGARKSSATTQVRENLEYAIAIIERQIHNARTISPCPIPGSQERNLTYIDQEGRSAGFFCVSVGSAGYVASSAASLGSLRRVTSDQVGITSCSFRCTQAGIGVPQSVDVTLTGQSRNTSNAEGSQVTMNAKIYLRTY